MSNKNYQALDDPTASMAADRVAETPELGQYKDLLIEYDWDNQEEHDHWVATAPMEEIVAWAKNIRQDEAQQEN